MAKTLQETWAENEAARKNQETRPMTHREKITAWVISVVVVVVLAAAIIWPRVVAWDSARLETARLAGHEAGKAEGFQLGLAAISIVRVTDAGDPSYNGLYYQAGVYAGKPAYTNGDKWLYWVYGPDPELQFGWWFLSSFKGGGETWYRSEVVSPGVLPDNLWSTNSLPTTILKVKKISGNQISAESK